MIYESKILKSHIKIREREGNKWECSYLTKELLQIQFIKVE